MAPTCVRRVSMLGQRWVDDGITPSLVLLAARRGVVFLHEAFGQLTFGDDPRPLQRDAIFPIASITKTFTATAIMMLVEDGLLGLTRAVQDYLPEFTGKGKDDVLVWHLLTHTSGLRGEDLVAFAAQREATLAPTQPESTEDPWSHRILQLRYQAPLWKPPGEQMSYCETNFVLLGEIVRRLSGTSYANFVQQRIFDPLGMTNTHLIVPDELEARVVDIPATAQFPGFGSREARKAPSASQGAYTSAHDLATFGQMYLNRGRYGDVRLLSPATVAEITRNQIPGISAELVWEYMPEASWGYGWSIQGNGKPKYFGGSLQPTETFIHSGASGASLWVDPVHEIVGIYLSTIMAFNRDRVQWSYDLFQNAIYGALNA
ncbi:MAG: serine hydrolase domain-containing protein [Dehalococcoidia bacterium]